MNITRAKMLARRMALECLVKYNDKMSLKDVAYALNVAVTTVIKDMNVSNVVWRQRDYLYYGERL